MQDYPHHYIASAAARTDSNVQLASPGIETIESAGPAEFGGPGDLWSPETLLVAAIADCFILSFKAIARASKLEWNTISCAVVGTLERVEKVTQFTEFKFRVTLEIPGDMEETKALRLLDKAERFCLITNSMTSQTHLQADVRVGELVA